MSNPMQRRGATVVFAIALLGCANKDGAPTKDSARGSATVDARPRPIVMPPTADEATTQDVAATSIVVMKQDGTVSVLPRFEAVGTIGIDLATLQPGPAVTIAELAAKTEEAQRQVRAEREAVDDAGGVGTKMQDPDGKMGKKPDHAGTNPCGDVASITTGLDDADIYGGLLGAEVQGGYGFAPGPGGGDGWGRIGVGAQARPYAAGLIGRSLKTTAFCGASTPLILADARAPAAKLVEVMSALPEAQLAVTTDGGAHARTLAIRYTFQAGNTPFGDDLEIGIRGTVTASWLIDATGTVKSARAAGVDPEVSSCVAAVVATIAFPKPKGGGVVEVSSYPFRFEPAGG